MSWDIHVPLSLIVTYTMCNNGKLYNLRDASIIMELRLDTVIFK